jgi:hypothetical protein
MKGRNRVSDVMAVRMTPEQHDFIEDLGVRLDVTAAECVRLLIEEAMGRDA